VAKASAVSTSVSSPSIAPSHFREVLGHFCSGITIVTSLDEGRPVGTVCQSFTALSLDPPLVAVCAGLGSTTWPRIRRSGRFCANVLTAHQEPLSRSFSVSGGDKFAGVDWAPSPCGLPVLADVLAWVECSIDAEVEAGDHTILIGRVLDLGRTLTPALPLLFFRGNYERLIATTAPNGSERPDIPA
jgi:3-hydroxy-9,10-secoandrosta-1,3,5(10)-triene-9,17-dione monooxygenase reductase component